MQTSSQVLGLKKLRGFVRSILNLVIHGFVFSGHLCEHNKPKSLLDLRERWSSIGIHS